MRSHMAGRSDLRIVRLRDSHLPEVFSLIDKENWGWEFAEIQQIHMLDECSSVVALDGRDIVGLVTCIDFGSTAFIVHVIVRKGWRGKGVGVRMMEAVLADMDSRGVSSVELHANPEAVEFYNQFSFRRLEDITFFAKEAPHSFPEPSTPKASSFSWLSPDDPPALSEALSAVFGYTRGDVEKALSRVPPHQALARMVSGRATALLLSRTGRDLNAAGPWFMDEPSRAEADGMIRTMLSSVPAKRVDVLSPASNEVAKATFESCGFSVAKAGIVRVSRSNGAASRFPGSVLAIGHVGLI